MSGKSPIQWTDASWNPVTGCTRVSAGCDHCYAFQLHDQRHIAWKRGRWEAAPAQYHRPFSQVQLLPARLEDPLHWRTPQRVFVNSMSDLFHQDVPDEYIARVFAVMAKAPQHTFQILTKRPERMEAFSGAYPRPLPNAWLGTSVEHQAAADERIPQLLRTPAAVRFLSCEPLLGPVDLDSFLAGAGVFWNAPLHWVILGGESGPHARPLDLAWVRDLIGQCQEAGVAVFVKQFGTVWAQRERRATGRRVDPHGGNMDEWPEELRIRAFPVVGGEGPR